MNRYFRSNDGNKTCEHGKNIGWMENRGYRNEHGQERKAAGRVGRRLRKASVMALVAGVMAGLGLGGCVDEATREQMAKNDSILAPIFHQPSPADAAAWASDEYDADKRARGTALLVAAPFGGEEPYLEMYRRYVEDESTNVRAAAARGLGQHGKVADVAYLTPLLRDKERIVRLEAAHALQRVHNPIAVGPMIERLDADKEPEPSVRAEIAAGLGQYAQHNVLEALITSLADDNFAVAYNAHQSLRTLTGQDQLSDDRREWARWSLETSEPFAHQRPYLYPAFSREVTLMDYLPFMPPVPNEPSASPEGMPRVDVEGQGE